MKGMRSPSIWLIALLFFGAMTTWMSGCWTTTSCFVAGTLIDTPRGPVKIETITIGQKIYGYDTKTKKRVVRKVTGVWDIGWRTYRYLRLPNGKELRVTPEHPVYLPAQDRYLPIRQLQAGQQVLVQPQKNNKQLEQKALEQRLSGIVGIARVYTLTVEDTANYFAQGLLVHNKSPPLNCTSNKDCGAGKICQGGDCIPGTSEKTTEQTPTDAGSTQD